MSVGDTLDYITLSNPISRVIISSSSAILRSLGLKPKQNGNGVVPIAQRPKVIHVHKNLPELIGRNYNFVRLGGFGGATAIIMGAYCKYNLRDIEDPKKQIEAQSASDVANRIHFLHSFALLAMPLTKHPVLTGTLMVAGTVLFSGSMYYRALTGEKDLQHLATCGGFVLIAAWITLIF